MLLTRVTWTELAADTAFLMTALPPGLAPPGLASTPETYPWVNPSHGFTSAQQGPRTPSHCKQMEHGFATGLSHRQKSQRGLTMLGCHQHLVGSGH